MKVLTSPKLNKVEVTSDFWKRYRELVVKEVLPYQWAVMNDEADISIAEDPQNNGQDKNSHAVANLKIAAGKMEGHHYGFPFQDTDVYKWLEAAAYSFTYHPNEDLKKITDELIDLIADAQDDDGYLSTYFQIDAPERKFKRLQQSHELYTMGHYIEAGVAYFQTTGNQKALDIATRMADCIDDNFGLEDGKIAGIDGHPEIELALARLYEVTDEQRYLDLAHYFLNQRGQDPDFFDRQIEKDGVDRDLIANMQDFPKSYYQNDKPIKDQEALTGHAVRVVYLCTGIAHVARLTGDQDLLAACKRFWNDIVKRRMYVTGNIGSTTTGESFTYDYDLPNDTMYGETCASVGMSFFAKQMLGVEAKGEYGDVLEKELFNGTLSGMSLDGKHFYYVNPLEADPVASKGNPGKSHVLTHRADWFGCACCPANLARLITSVDRYIYTVKGDTVLSHQFISNNASFENGVSVEQTNNFPWAGDIHYTISNPEGAEFSFGIRIPGWSKSTDIKVNGQAADLANDNGFVYVQVAEGTTTTIDLDLDMSTKFMRSNNRNEEDYGQVAVQRGPIVYAAEQEDNEIPLWLYKVNTKEQPEYHFDEQLLDGVGVVSVVAEKPVLDDENDDLYVEDKEEKLIPSKLTLIPYYSWANRSDGQMRVWLNKQ
ncbi:beta-L-arabinofuranosidase domain-containing protein [Lentilactobacillus sp. Marseille-Q4993]|uniref:glycoside hydrolase family 127 protein n=1 Tax=Lentilactobacillus sp. Marseille-Q4993 TaxID=3039492 RepID=UPI0024BCFA61|nr:beta-L-arabinofuranosidase domain-containing protein [Lentilactobacillus sp. Marseille-Q4993]